MTKVCARCGDEFQVKPSHAHKRVTCSRACSAMEYQTRMRGSANPNFRNAGKHACSQCGSEFHSYNKARKFCSNACRGAAARKPRDRGVQAPLDLEFAHAPSQDPLRIASPQASRYRICPVCRTAFLSRRSRVYCKACSYEHRPCVACGASFVVHRSNPKKTCGPSCARRHRADRQRGEQSHRWQGGKTPEARLLRSSLDYQQWREAVFERDDFTCGLCGTRGGRLAAHHIRRFAERPELRMDVSNGITLCWSPCHTSIRHKEEQFEERFDAVVERNVARAALAKASA